MTIKQQVYDTRKLSLEEAYDKHHETANSTSIFNQSQCTNILVTIFSCLYSSNNSLWSVYSYSHSYEQRCQECWNFVDIILMKTRNLCQDHNIQWNYRNEDEFIICLFCVIYRNYIGKWRRNEWFGSVLMNLRLVNKCGV